MRRDNYAFVLVAPNYSFMCRAPQKKQPRRKSTPVVLSQPTNHKGTAGATRANHPTARFTTPII